MTETGVRHINARNPVQGSMEWGDLALPLVRTLVLAVVVTALIMFGLPAVLALGAAAGA